MRRINNNDYNDNFMIVQAAKVRSFYKVAIKIPSVHKGTDLNGMLKITSPKYSDIIRIPLNTKIVLPSLVNGRMLFDNEIGMYHLKFGMKNPKRQDFKISFRNKGCLS